MGIEIVPAVLPRLAERAPAVPVRRLPSWIGAAFAAWTVFGLLFAFAVYWEVRTHGHSPARILAYTLLVWYAWAAVTPLLGWLARRFPLVPPSARSIAVHVAVAVTAGVLHGAWWTALVVWMRPFDAMGIQAFWPHVADLTRQRLFFELMVYGAVVGVLSVVDAQRRLREREVTALQLEASLAHARLHALELQIQPHFLFNTLHAIGGLVRQARSSEAVAMIAGLSDLLRYSLDHAGEHLVPLARDTLRLGLVADPEIEIVGACSGADAAPIVAATRPDILFLDVQMPGRDGFALLETIGPGTVPVIVFVTAYDRYALKAFEVHALDYLLKPFDDRRLAGALRRAKEQLRSKQARSLEERLVDLLEERERASQPFLERFVVRARERTLFVPSDTVDWIRGADDYVELHAGLATHLLRERLADLETRLDPSRFARIHRSTIVNLSRVREMHALFRGDSIVVLHDGARLRLSRGRRAEFERRLSGSPQPRSTSPQGR